MPGLTRWYDPYIAHFAQADSVLDNPITGWDRYSYVQNNPLSFTDPSGHETDQCASDPMTLGCPQPEYITKQNNPNTWDEIDTSLLKSNKAQNLYLLYTEMWKQKDGWWWDKYGEGGFTVWEFMAVMWSYEQAGYSPGRNVSASMANHAAAWCATQGCDSTTAEGALSFLVAYSSSAQKRAESVLFKHKSLGDVFYKPPSYYSDGMHVVAAIYARASTLVHPTWLYDFGNVSLSIEVLGKMIKRGMVYDYWGTGDSTFIVMTKCQADFYDYVVAHGGARAVTMSTYRLYCGG